MSTVGGRGGVANEPAIDVALGVEPLLNDAQVALLGSFPKRQRHVCLLKTTPGRPVPVVPMPEGDAATTAATKHNKTPYRQAMSSLQSASQGSCWQRSGAAIRE